MGYHMTNGLSKRDVMVHICIKQHIIPTWYIAFIVGNGIVLTVYICIPYGIFVGKI